LGTTAWNTRHLNRKGFVARSNRAYFESFVSVFGHLRINRKIPRNYFG
jgi:hypothetical protein